MTSSRRHRRAGRPSRLARLRGRASAPGVTDMNLHLLPLPSIQHRIDVARIRLDRQRLEPARDLVGGLPALLDEGLALAERGLVVAITPRGAAREAAERQVALDGGELE